MPRGPKGERRPADVIANAVKVMRIATGEEPEDAAAASDASRARGRKGAAARAAGLEKSERAAIARKAAEARWNKK